MCLPTFLALSSTDGLTSNRPTVRDADSNPRDFRAWYGLGQTYELLDMPQYAIQYYNKATALRCVSP